MTRPAARQEPHPESGFALLVIFLIAAAVAFTMYQELPRAAFESARDKEQLLMDRGNQYKRAIQVFYAVNKRYPAELKDLENTNEKRFLRRRYIDPMTGKDEWRLVHTNGSFLTDSLVTKPPAQNASNGSPGAGQMPGGGPLGANNLNSAPASSPAVTANDPNAAAVPAPLNAAAQRRPSDRGFPTGPGFPQPPGAFAPGNSTNPVVFNPANFNADDPSTWPPITLATPASPSGQPQPGLAQRPGLGGLGGANPPPAASGNTNSLAQNGLVAAPVADPSAQANATQATIVPNLNSLPAPVDVQPPPQSVFPPNQSVSPSGIPGFNPQNPTPQPAAASNNTSNNTSNNPALNAIDNALFRPNQAPTTGPTGSPGIAGVASTFKGPSIKAYKERTKYQEWEFVYEPAVNQPGSGPPGATQPGANSPGQPATPAPAAGQTPAPGNPFSLPNPFGQPQ